MFEQFLKGHFKYTPESIDNKETSKKSCIHIDLNEYGGQSKQDKNTDKMPWETIEQKCPETFFFKPLCF